MIELNTAQLASNVANLLLFRGAEVPPLQWHLKPNQAAKELLDRTQEDTALFGKKELADEGMCAAVRALLYLWNGWPAECSMYAQGASDKERIYLGAFCERQAGHAAEAKELFQKSDHHSVFGPLMVYSLEVIGLTTDRTLSRFKQILELGGVWEPFAFVDLCEQARVGKPSHLTEQAACRIQCREFELLFAHCYEGALGEPLRGYKATTPVKRPKPRPTRRPTKQPTKQPAQAKASTKRKPAVPIKDVRKATEPRVGTLCPKCGHMVIVPESRRGKSERCSKCCVLFLIPLKSTPAGAPKNA